MFLKFPHNISSFVLLVSGSHLSCHRVFLRFLKQDVSDLHFSCNLAAVTIVLAISPFLLLTFHVLSTLRVLVTKSVRISYKTESINFLCLVMMGTDDVCHQQKINDRRTVDACGSLFFPPFLFSSSTYYYYYSTFNARRDDPRRHLVDGDGDGYKKHIRVLSVSLNFSRSANLEKKVVEISAAV